MGPRTSSRSVVEGPSTHGGVASLIEADRSDGTSDAPMLLDRRRDVLVIRPLGRLDAGTIERLGQVVAESSTATIVDLDECFLADPGALAAIDDSAFDGVEVCIVSGRLSCRRLLARAGATARFAVFQCQEDALQARLLATEGYGRGWSMAGVDQARPATVTPGDSLRIETSRGRLAATVELHGELCSSTTPQLHDEIRRLIDDGITHVTVDLTELRLCTSHGLDAFERAHRRLCDERDGALELRNARGSVDRVLTIVEDADPTFPPMRRTSAR